MASKYSCGVYVNGRLIKNINNKSEFADFLAKTKKEMEEKGFEHKDGYFYDLFVNHEDGIALYYKYGKRVGV